MVTIPKRLIVFAAILVPAVAMAAGGSHVDPAAPIILGVTTILVFAVIGRYFARRLGQPTVLGELVIGIALLITLRAAVANARRVQ